MMNSKITSQVYRRHGSPSPQTLKLSSEEIPIEQKTEILIRIHAIVLNYRDANILNGTNPWSVSANGIPRSDVAGGVIFVGTAATRFKIGDGVCPIF
jgi:NADPH:quinone reductase-like Zn-dependent oxidoreductase